MHYFHFIFKQYFNSKFLFTYDMILFVTCLFIFFLVIIYEEEEGGKKKGGNNAVLHWVEGELIIFKQLIGASSFFRFCKGF